MMEGEGKMTIVFVFKNGFELRMKCEDFLLHRNGLGIVTGYESKDVSENKPIWFNFEDILCIYRVMSDEEEDFKYCPSIYRVMSDEEGEGKCQ